jgi:hypothetical protein
MGGSVASVGTGLQPGVPYPGTCAASCVNDITKATRARYALEYKQETVRLVDRGQSQASVACSADCPGRVRARRHQPLSLIVDDYR